MLRKLLSMNFIFYISLAFVTLRFQEAYAASNRTAVSWKRVYLVANKVSVELPSCAKTTEIANGVVIHGAYACPLGTPSIRIDLLKRLDDVKNKTDFWVEIKDTSIDGTECFAAKEKTKLPQGHVVDCLHGDSSEYEFKITCSGYKLKVITTSSAKWSGLQKAKIKDLNLNSEIKRVLNSVKCPGL